MRGRPAGSAKIDYTRVEEQYDPSITDKANAKNIGISESAFACWRRTKRYETCERKTVNIDEETFYRLYNLGYSDYQIAKELETRAQSIFNYRKKNGIPTNHPWVGRSSAGFIETAPFLTDDDKPWKDPESLYCDGKFLEKFKRGEFEV